MKTDFFTKKKIFQWGISLLSFATIIVTIIYAFLLAGVQRVELNKNFYFLVSDSTHIEASTHTAKFQGGAGYLVTFKDKEYVAYAVYLSESEGNAVQATMTNESTTLLCKNVQRLYLKTRKDKEKAKVYQSGLSCLYSCMEILNAETARLEKGATQQSAKNTLGILLKQLSYLGEAYQKEYAACSNVFEEAGASLSSLLNDTLYVKDLRYLLCELADGYISLASKFNL